jgi:DNA-directed RNA polymerase subunit RPC12/RpoP
MRKVNLRYRCTLCGAEMRMTLAADEDPDPPRHCQEEMSVVAPIE